MCWTSAGHAFRLIVVRVGHLDRCWYELDIWWSRVGHVLDMCARYVMGVWVLCWTCVGHVLDMCSKCVGHVSDVQLTCVGHVLDMFGTCVGHV